MQGRVRRAEIGPDLATARLVGMMGIMAWLYAAILLLIDTLGFFLVVLGFPGTWLMVIAAAGVSWLSGRSGPPLISNVVLWVLVGLALLGEVAELAAGAAGSRRAGGSWRGSAGALLLGMVGGIVGTFAIPVPVIGSILGACAGAFAGALAGELWGGRSVKDALTIGRGAFNSRFIGTILKVAIGAVIWLVATAASFFW
jgi:uncharacterized protein YqgC (DUF456 family)